MDPDQRELARLAAEATAAGEQAAKESQAAKNRIAEEENRRQERRERHEAAVEKLRHAGPQRIEYEGKVRLESQEGGFANPVIVLSDIGKGTPQDMQRKIKAMLGVELAKTLDEALIDKLFDDVEIIDLYDDNGYVELGELKITIERAGV